MALAQMSLGLRSGPLAAMEGAPRACSAALAASRGPASRMGMSGGIGPRSAPSAGFSIFMDRAETFIWLRCAHCGAIPRAFVVCGSSGELVPRTGRVESHKRERHETTRD